MLVRTLSAEELKKASAKLLNLAVVDGFAPTHLIGVARGGVFVAEAMHSVSGLPLLTLTCQRSSTNKKSRILASLPYSVTNPLRKIEHRFLRRPRKDEREVVSSFLEQDALTSIDDGSRILIVDDAVDSGVTLRSVINHVKKITKNCQVRAAAIVLTSPETAIIVPDYTLFKGELVRFHWSNDFRG